MPRRAGDRGDEPCSAQAELPGRFRPCSMSRGRARPGAIAQGRSRGRLVADRRSSCCGCGRRRSSRTPGRTRCIARAPTPGQHDDRPPHPVRAASPPHRKGRRRSAGTRSGPRRDLATRRAGHWRMRSQVVLATSPARLRACWPRIVRARRSCSPRGADNTAYRKARGGVAASVTTRLATPSREERVGGRVRVCGVLSCPDEHERLIVELCAVG